MPSDTVAILAASSRADSRDHRLDFWRGLCIVNMVLIHLLEQGLRSGELTWTILFDYLRFAAGGFVMLAGFCVGAIHLRKAMNPSRRGKVYASLYRRAGVVLLAHYLAELIYLLQCPLRSEALDLPANFLNILLLRQGYDLLPFYVLMLCLCPPMLELLRRGLGWVVLGISAAAFALGAHNPWLGTLPIHQHFFPLLWQLIFVIGLLLGANLTRYDALAVTGKRGVLVAATGSLIALLWLRSLGEASWLPFHKLPLSFAEAMRYVALTLVILCLTDLTWRLIEPLRVRRFVGRLGRRSLPMFILHILLVGWMVKLSFLLPEGWMVTLLFMAATVGLLWLCARALDWLTDHWRTLLPQAPRFEHAAIPALLVAVVFCLWAVNVPSITAETNSSLSVASEAELPTDDPAEPQYDPDTLLEHFADVQVC